VASAVLPGRARGGDDDAGKRGIAGDHGLGRGGRARRCAGWGWWGPDPGTGRRVCGAGPERRGGRDLRQRCGPATDRWPLPGLQARCDHRHRAGSGRFPGRVALRCAARSDRGRHRTQDTGRDRGRRKRRGLRSAELYPRPLRPTVELRGAGRGARLWGRRRRRPRGPTRGPRARGVSQPESEAPAAPFLDRRNPDLRHPRDSPVTCLDRRGRGLRTHDADTPHGANLHRVGHVAARRHRALVGKQRIPAPRRVSRSSREVPPTSGTSTSSSNRYARRCREHPGRLSVSRPR
jgi:hypothetical protein